MEVGKATATTTVVSEWILRGRLAVREMVLMNASAALYAAGKVWYPKFPKRMTAGDWAKMMVVIVGSWTNPRNVSEIVEWCEVWVIKLLNRPVAYAVVRKWQRLGWLGHFENRQLKNWVIVQDTCENTVCLEKNMSSDQNPGWLGYIGWQTTLLYTPWKINMKPTHHPCRKENNLPNLHDYVPCWSSGMYMDYFIGPFFRIPSLTNWGSGGFNGSCHGPGFWACRGGVVFSCQLGNEICYQFIQFWYQKQKPQIETARCCWMEDFMKGWFILITNNFAHCFFTSKQYCLYWLFYACSP